MKRLVALRTARGGAFGDKPYTDLTLSERTK